MTTPTPPRRSWYRSLLQLIHDPIWSEVLFPREGHRMSFSLRTLFVVVTLLCVFFAAARWLINVAPVLIIYGPMLAAGTTIVIYVWGRYRRLRSERARLNESR